MKLLSWNVNGLRAVLRKGFADWAAASDADVIALQEIKATPDQVPELDIPGYPIRLWHPAQRKGYSGVMLLAREAPDEVRTGLGVAAYDDEGRFLAARWGDLWVATTYVPNAKRDLSRLADRQNWDTVLRHTMQQLAQEAHVAVGGDFNVAHQEIDLARPEANVGHHGFTAEERAGFSAHLRAGFLDTFRHTHPGEPNHYTWWQQFGGARERNVGWRIDYWLLDRAAEHRLRRAWLLPEVHGSDHCPVGLELA